MADVEWDDKEHAGLGVQVPSGDNRVLISSDTPSLWLTALPDFTDFLLFNRNSLTPNGKRYELREIGAGEPDVRRARALVEELARDHKLIDLTDGRLARVMNEVLDALAENKPDHPEVLETLEDYQNAPEGTLAASVNGEGYFHNETMSRWESTHGDWKNLSLIHI